MEYSFDAASIWQQKWPTFNGSLSIKHLAGDASNRVYYRLTPDSTGPWPATVVAMVMGGDPLKSEEATAGEAPTELPFLSMQRYLAGIELPVPEIFIYDPDRGVLLLADLGDEMLYNAVEAASEATTETLYRQAIDLLIMFQLRTRETPPARAVCDRRFDAKLLRWELEHFREYGMTRPFTADELPIWERYRDRIVERVASSEYRLCHRDYQSRNLMLYQGGLLLIDFQDALYGPPTYDLVALLRDSYIPLGPELVDRLVDYYLSEHPEYADTEQAEHFRSLFHWNTVQRKLKDSGRFVFIDRVKGNDWFLPFIPDSVAYVRQSLGRIAELGELQELLARTANGWSVD